MRSALTEVLGVTSFARHAHEVEQRRVGLEMKLIAGMLVALILAILIAVPLLGRLKNAAPHVTTKTSAQRKQERLVAIAEAKRKLALKEEIDRTHVKSVKAVESIHILLDRYRSAKSAKTAKEIKAKALKAIHELINANRNYGHLSEKLGRPFDRVDEPYAFENR